MLTRLCVVFILLGLGFETSASDFEDRKGWRFGLAIGLHRDGEYAVIDWATPALFRYSLISLEQEAGLVVLTGFHDAHNAFTDNGRQEVAQSWVTGIALESRGPIVNKSLRSYSRMGGVHIAKNNKAYRESEGYAFMFGFGMDMVLVQSREDLIGGDSSATFFMQTAGFFGLGRAERMTGSPDLFNGFTLSMGIRNHF